jgi:hypothetical protein
MCSWCGNVLEYQARLSAIEWKDYDLAGTAANEIIKKDKSSIGRVVEESSSALLPIAGVASVAFLGAAAYLARYGPRRIR